MKLFFVWLFTSISLIAQAQINWVKHPQPVLPRSAVYPKWDGVALLTPVLCL
jgi:hypothetical protein